MKIYLCGPIMDEHDGVASAWREIAKKALSKDFTLLDPMRRNFKDREVDSANEIVEFDLQDVRDADIVLVNYSKNSIGTAMEVFYASHDLNKFRHRILPLRLQGLQIHGWSNSAPKYYPTSSLRLDISTNTSLCRITHPRRQVSCGQLPLIVQTLPAP